MSLTETIERFRSNLRLYCAACLTIRDKKARFHNLELNEAQNMVHDKLSQQLQETGRIRCIILKARQEGISTYVAARFFRAIHLWSGIVAMIVADSLTRAEDLFGIYDRYYINLPQELLPRKKGTQRGRYMAFTHDSELSVRPATDSEAGRAKTLHRLHASELAFWGPGARETWVSLMQAVPPDSGEVIIESTAKGIGGLFHEIWMNAINDEESVWLPIFLPWWIHKEYEKELPPDEEKYILDTLDDFEKQALYQGIPYEGEVHKLSLEKLYWRRSVIAEKFGGSTRVAPPKDAVREFQQEYPATAEEAFLVSGSCFFDEEKLRAMTMMTREPILRGKLVDVDGTFIVERGQKGPLQIWDAPDPKRHYVIGADTASGKLVAAFKRDGSDSGEERDASAGIVIRLAYVEDGINYPPKIVAVLHGPIVPEIFADQLRMLGAYYQCGGPVDGTYATKAMMGVENNHSSGQTILRLLNEHYHYAPLFRQREMNKTTRRVGFRYGWRTDEVTRMPMLDELARLIREDSIEIPSKDVLMEMVTFIVWENGKPAANDGCHDDRVMAAALGVQMMREHRHSHLGVLPEWDESDSLVE